MSATLKQNLGAVHTQLEALGAIDKETRQLLLLLLADISRLLEANAAPPADISPTDAVETIAARFDADHPALSTAVRQLIDALSKAGI